MEKYNSPEIEIEESVDVVFTSGEIDLTGEDREVETVRLYFK